MLREGRGSSILDLDRPCKFQYAGKRNVGKLSLIKESYSFVRAVTRHNETNFMLLEIVMCQMKYDLKYETVRQ